MEISTDDSQRQLVFERIYAHFHTEGRWPGLDGLQRQLASEHIDANIRSVVTTAREYAAIEAAGGEEPTQRVRLLLRGLAEVPAARPLLSAYIEALHEMLARYRDLESEPQYGAADLAKRGLDPRIKAELTQFLLEDRWGLGGGQHGEDWSFEISDEIVGVDAVQTVEDLLALRFGESSMGEDDGSGPAMPTLAIAGREEAGIEADLPITRPEEDLLGRAPLAEALAAQATEQTKDKGFVMGVSGPWGSGKTSLLNLLAAKAEEGGAHVVRFDPWLFSSSEELVLRFLREMSAQLGREGNERKLSEVADQIGEYAQILAPAAALTPAAWAAPILTVSGRVIGRRKNRVPVSAEEQREAVREALLGVKQRIVVLIDDLDRLQRGEIRDVVRLVKLVGDFPNTTYVLAYDRTRVARALSSEGDEEGQAFLEKIVQTSHEVPPAARELLSRVLVEAIGAAVGELSHYRFDETAFTNVFADGLRSLFTTVRDVRRFANVLPPTLALVGEEVELSDLLALEALRVRLPETFEAIIAGKGALTEPHQIGLAVDQGKEAAARAKIEAIITSSPAFEEEVRAIIGRLFGASQRYLGGSHYGTGWSSSWRREGRVAHREVLEIYIGRGLPPGVLPAGLVEEVFSNLLEAEALSDLLEGLDSEELESLLGRLEDYESELPTERSEVPISVLYNYRGRLRSERRGVLDPGADHKVGRIVLRLLQRLEPGEIERATRAAGKRINTFSDRGELVRLVGHTENAGHKLIDEERAADLEADFFGDLLGAETVALNEERELCILLWWAHSQRPEDTSRRVKELVEDDGFLLGLLRSALNESVSQGEGEAAVRRRYRFDWHLLTELVPAERLVARVRELEESGVGDRDQLGSVALEQAVQAAAGHSAEVDSEGPSDGTETST